MDDVRTSTAWTGWVGFAAIMLVIIGAIDFFEGLIAVIRGSYYQYTPQGIVVFSTKEWGWIHIIVGILLILIGLALAAKSSWARWAAVIVIIVNLLAQLGWLGNSQYPLWSLTVITLQIIVLYALTARWGEVSAY